MSAPQVFAFAVSCTAFPGQEAIVNAPTAGRAKYSKWLDIRDAWEDVPITAMRARKIGAPHTSEAFARNAVYRGLPGLTCGRRVRVTSGGQSGIGTIIGHNDSANLDILFDDDSPIAPGQVCNVHPAECVVLPSPEAVAPSEASICPSESAVSPPHPLQDAAVSGEGREADRG